MNVRMKIAYFSNNQMLQSSCIAEPFSYATQTTFTNFYSRSLLTKVIV